MSSLGSEVYSGLATYGRIRTIIGLVITGVICIVLLILGIISISKKPTRTSTTDGKINLDGHLIQNSVLLLCGTEGLFRVMRCLSLHTRFQTLKKSQ